MLFQRGLDVKESLGLGKFTKVSKDLRETMDMIISNNIQRWSSYVPKVEKAYQVEPAEIKFENRPDKGGGNVNRFYTYLSLNDFGNYPALKDQIKDGSFHLNLVVQGEAKIIAINYFIGPKSIRKAGFNLWKNPFLIEVVYVKF